MAETANWTAVDAEIERIISGSADEPFDASTVANVRELVSFAREHCPVPDTGEGYRRTFRLTWNIPSVEVEIFADRFEVYRFHDQRTDIKEVRHTPGSPFPQELAFELPRLDSK